MTTSEFLIAYIESTDGDRFEVQIPADTRLDTLAADFFEERNWPLHDVRGRSQRAVVELVDPENPNRTKRLRGEQTVTDAGLWNGAILRVFPESTAGPDPGDSKGVLTINVSRAGPLAVVVGFLSSLKDAYDNLYAFELVMEQLADTKTGNQQSSGELAPILAVDELVLSADALFIERVRIESPGFWQMIGCYSPLKHLQAYLGRRQERQNDEDWRSREEEKRAVLENKHLETELLEKKIALLYEAGFSREEVHRFVTRHFYKPLASLDVYQESGMVGSADLVPADEAGRSGVMTLNKELKDTATGITFRRVG